MIKTNTCLVLLSGGMDSTVALFEMMHADYTAHCLTFDYGQRHRQEVLAAVEIRKRAKAWYPDKMGQHLILTIPQGLIPNVGSLMRADVGVRTEGHDQGGDPAFIPHRNLVFLSIAATWATDLGVSRIVTGLRGGFSDCTTEFEFRMQNALNSSNPAHPLGVQGMHISREETVRLATKIPGCIDTLGHSVTCFQGKRPGCGKCLPCTKRAEGFAKVGIHDPAYRVSLSEIGAQ